MINNSATAAVSQVSSGIADTFVAFFTDNILIVLAILLLVIGLAFLLKVTKKFSGDSWSNWSRDTWHDGFDH